MTIFNFWILGFKIPGFLDKILNIVVGEESKSERLSFKLKAYEMLFLWIFYVKNLKIWKHLTITLNLFASDFKFFVLKRFNFKYLYIKNIVSKLKKTKIF